MCMQDGGYKKRKIKGHGTDTQRASGKGRRSTGCTQKKDQKTKQANKQHRAIRKRKREYGWEQPVQGAKYSPPGPHQGVAGSPVEYKHLLKAGQKKELAPMDREETQGSDPRIGRGEEGSGP